MGSNLDGAAERRATLGRKTERRRLDVELHERRETLRGKAERRRLYVEQLERRSIFLFIRGLCPLGPP